MANRSGVISSKLNSSYIRKANPDVQITHSPAPA